MEKNKLSGEGSFMTVAKARGHTDFSLTISGKYWNDEVEALHKQYMHEEESPAAPAVDAAKLDDLTRYEVVIEPRNHYYRLREDVEPLGEYVKFADVAALVAQQAARIAELEVEATKSREFTRVCGNVIHNMTVGNQAAWIEWRHGGGAEKAMEWIENGLIGPGMIPGEGEDDENDPNLTNAQAYFDAHVSYGDDATTKEGK